MEPPAFVSYIPAGTTWIFTSNLLEDLPCPLLFPDFDNGCVCLNPGISLLLSPVSFSTPQSKIDIQKNKHFSGKASASLPVQSYWFLEKTFELVNLRHKLELFMIFLKCTKAKLDQQRSLFIYSSNLRFMSICSSI